MLHVAVAVAAADKLLQVATSCGISHISSISISGIGIGSIGISIDFSTVNNIG